MKIARNIAMLIALAALASQPASADSLFSQRTAEAGTLVTEKVNRFEPGDIITVLIRESLEARTRAETNTTKESDVESTAPAAGNPFLVGQQPDGNNIFNPGELPNWQIESENETKNDGDTRRRNTLTTSITCTVVESANNGTIRLEGEKQVTVNREDSTIQFAGTVRAKDVTQENTVQSTQIANLQVHVKGKGPLWNNQRRGLITRFLDWFSPF